MGTASEEFIAALSQDHDVIIIGGLAVIAHGLSRATMDADIWLRPMESAGVWAQAVERFCAKFDNITIHTLPGWKMIEGAEVAEAASEVGMVRVLGLNCPIDIFRRPNEFAEDAFDDVMSRCVRNADGTLLPDALDLAISKHLTGRDKDVGDIRFLESLIHKRWIDRLPAAEKDEALDLLNRFADWKTCESALSNPNPEVRDQAIIYLREFAADGDPFSQAILENREIP
jgi:hypothetical protein